VVLSDRTIRELLASGRIRVQPCDAADVQPSSIDVHLGARFQVFRNSRYPYIDPGREQAGLMEMVEATAEVPFVLHPGEFVLGATTEYVGLPDDLVARLEGKSSLGRLGLLSTPASRGRSPWSFPTWPTCPSSSRRVWRSGRSPSCA
jgi:dCTP deaminase